MRAAVDRFDGEFARDRLENGQSLPRSLRGNQLSPTRLAVSVDWRWRKTVRMSYRREHRFEDGRKWSTGSDYPSVAYVVVPIDQLEGLSAEQIGSRVIGLMEQARVTDLLNWAKSYRNPWLEAKRVATGPKKKYTPFCVRLGSDEKGWFHEIEKFKHLDADLQESHREICKIMDETLNYFRTKKTRLTPVQRNVFENFLELRRGCELCGLVEGKHSPCCRNLNYSAAETDTSSVR